MFGYSSFYEFFVNMWFDIRLFALLVYYLYVSMATYALFNFTFTTLTSGGHAGGHLITHFLGIILSPIQIAINFVLTWISRVISGMLNGAIDSINVLLAGLSMTVNKLKEIFQQSINQITGMSKEAAELVHTTEHWISDQAALVKKLSNEAVADAAQAMKVTSEFPKLAEETIVRTSKELGGMADRAVADTTAKIDKKLSEYGRAVENMTSEVGKKIDSFINDKINDLKHKFHL